MAMKIEFIVSLTVWVGVSIINNNVNLRDLKQKSEKSCYQHKIWNKS